MIILLLLLFHKLLLLIVDKTSIEIFSRKLLCKVMSFSFVFIFITQLYACYFIVKSVKTSGVATVRVPPAISSSNLSKATSSATILENGLSCRNCIAATSITESRDLCKSSSSQAIQQIGLSCLPNPQLHQSSHIRS